MSAVLPPEALAAIERQMPAQATRLAAQDSDSADGRALLDAMDIAVYRTDAAGRLDFYNEAAARFWGWRPPLGEQRWCGSWRLWTPDGQPLAHDDCPMAICLREGREIRGRWAWAERPDGTRVPFVPLPTPLRDAEGQVTGAVNVLVDISGLRAAEAERDATAAWFRAAQDAAPDGFLVLRAMGRATGAAPDFEVRHANHAAARLLGADLADVALSALPGAGAATLRALAAEVAATGRPAEREVAIGAALGAGGALVLRQRLQPLGDGVAAWIADVTERHQAAARIRHAAMHDQLTGLPNRACFRERLVEALAAGGRELAVLCLDIDNFKRVNDALGHATGDELLRQAAARLKAALRGDDLLARLGGDEFGILLRGPGSPGHAEVLARRLAGLMARPFALAGGQAHAGTSIGIACDGDGRPEEAADTLLRNADVALYRAKAAGRGTWRLFAPAMADALRARHALEADLREAEARGELELHYQPLADLQDFSLRGFEALLRWRHPRRGLVPPSEFVPVAEETGLILPVGEWALRRACADAAAWPRPVKVAVNLSAAQFAGTGVPALVAAVLADSGLPPARLEIEITESVLLAEEDRVIAALHALRALGVRVALDDFGTQYSSLSYLRRFPFDKIKIDRSFVRDAAERRECRAIVRSVAGLARELGMAATAEGVETAEHLALACAAGCTEGQGYLIGRPKPAAALGARFEGVACGVLRPA
jgi:diguanylate cyclase (GGDEF)-like protein